MFINLKWSLVKVVRKDSEVVNRTCWGNNFNRTLTGGNDVVHRKWIFLISISLHNKSNIFYLTVSSNVLVSTHKKVTKYICSFGGMFYTSLLKSYSFIETCKLPLHFSIKYGRQKYVIIWIYYLRQKCFIFWVIRFTKFGTIYLMPNKVWIIFRSVFNDLLGALQGLIVRNEMFSEVCK